MEAVYASNIGKQYCCYTKGLDKRLNKRRSSQSTQGVSFNSQAIEILKKSKYLEKRHEYEVWIRHLSRGSLLGIIRLAE